MAHFGMVASTDPVASVQACSEEVVHLPDPGKAALLRRMNALCGISAVEGAAASAGCHCFPELRHAARTSRNIDNEEKP